MGGAGIGLPARYAQSPFGRRYSSFRRGTALTHGLVALSAACFRGQAASILSTWMAPKSL